MYQKKNLIMKKKEKEKGSFRQENKKK